MQIITRLDSIDNALEHWEEVKHKTYRESLHNNPDLIASARRWRIRLDLEVQLDLDEIKAGHRIAPRLTSVQGAEFSALTRGIADAAASLPRQPVHSNYET